MTRTETAHSVGRGTRWDTGPVRVVRFRTPDTDPYELGFDQHDDSLYTTEKWTLIVGRLTVSWRVKREAPSASGGSGDAPVWEEITDVPGLVGKRVAPRGGSS